MSLGRSLPRDLATIWRRAIAAPPLKDVSLGAMSAQPNRADPAPAGFPNEGAYRFQVSRHRLEFVDVAIPRQHTPDGCLAYPDGHVTISTPSQTDTRPD